MGIYDGEEGEIGCLKNRFTKGVLITSGQFSRDCKDFVNDKRIELFDVNLLCGLLEKYDVFIETTSTRNV